MEGLQEGGGLETVAMTQRQKVKLQVADLKIFVWSDQEGQDQNEQKHSGHIGENMLKMEKKKPTEKIHECSEGGHEKSWCDRSGCCGQNTVEVDDALW